ncbi:MAG TPA: hypothetical protein VD908_09750 [Cytophagales bacterium]|nr:hypothetical protein [Cytophagales bacterium]
MFNRIITYCLIINFLNILLFTENHIFSSIQNTSFQTKVSSLIEYLVESSFEDNDKNSKKDNTSDLLETPVLFDVVLSHTHRYSPNLNFCLYQPIFEYTHGNYNFTIKVNSPPPKSVLATFPNISTINKS